jgi:cell division septum initiation protein DivIVA
VGVERAVTRWYAQRQLLLEEIARLEAELAEPPDAQDSVPTDAVDPQPLQKELTKAQEKLRFLGHCPQPMMG